MPELNLSVRSLVEFVLRSGNLEAIRFIARERAVEGTRGHRKLQSLKPAEYQAELSLSRTVSLDGVSCTISGRADGAQIESSSALVEEIKTIVGPFESTDTENPLHWGQAKIYAWMIAEQHGIPVVDVQVTFVRLDPWEVHEDCRPFQREDLCDFVHDLLKRYLKWMGPYLAWRQNRDQSIGDLEFPFQEYRPGQRRFAVAVYRTIEARQKLFAQAPTGIGKTVSALFPTIKAMGEGLLDKIWYLTAKTVGRTVAEATIENLRHSGMTMKSLTLTARDKTCFNPLRLPTCDPERCEFAIGYFDRVNTAVADALQNDALTRTVVEETARKHTVCPFELSLDLSNWADIVICDYNYVFDPRAYLRRFFQDESERHVFLIDEAHNLLDRARDMYSASLSKESILELRRTVKNYRPDVVKSLAGLNRRFLDYRKRCEASDTGGEFWTAEGPPDGLIPALKRFQDRTESVLASGVPFAGRQDLLEFYFEVVAFLRVAEFYDDRYVTYCEETGREVLLKLFCLDPSKLLNQRMSRGAGTVLFSATLTPLTYYRELLGGDDMDPTMSLDSPFPPENLRIVIADNIGTTYKLRADSYEAVADAVLAAVSGKAGNYMVFFPSYRYMREIADRVQKRDGDLDMAVQSPGMSESDRESFLSQFETDRADSLVVFAIMGGIFGEGIDLVGDRLVGAIVVGVGLPQVSLERDLLRGYFDELDLDGFAYAYTYPGMIRVLQAAGRVVRTDEDRGLVLLVDTRFGYTSYQRQFPHWWHPITDSRSPNHIRKAALDFWR